MKRIFFIVLSIMLGGLAMADSPTSILRAYEAEAGSAGSVERGRTLFMAQHTGGKPETPKCTSCHSENLKGTGQTRVGKVIEPMALSVNPERLTDAAFTAKWFRRNCNSVLGRECTAQEKADVIAFLMSI